MLQNRNALVVGGAVGIGRAVCLALAEAGANVMVADKGWADEKETLLAYLEGFGVRAAAAEVDVVEEASVAHVVSTAIAAFGHLDILINNAGITSGGAPVHAQDWDVGTGFSTST